MRRPPPYPFVLSYFVWDASDSIINFIDAGYVVHGVFTRLMSRMRS